MTQLQSWFQRTFEFNFPVEQYPNICVRLRGTPARLEEIARDFGENILVRKPDGKWSAQEHAGHLADLEPLWMARVNDFVCGKPTLSAADLTNQKTEQANHNARSIREILKEFRAARSQLMQRVETLEPAWFSRTLMHPRLKQPMRLVDHLFFVAEHDDHHLARIWELTGTGAMAHDRTARLQS